MNFELYKEILSPKSKNLEELSFALQSQYSAQIPYPHIELDNFFSEEFLSSVINEFPDLSKIKGSENYKNLNEIKFAYNDYNKFPKNIKFFFDFLNSSYFLKFLQNLTSIKEKLIADKDLNGGGLHEIKSGGLLKVHTDFNRHPSKELDRRVNVLIYLNKNWKKEYNGCLELWDKDMKFCKKKILPNFNKMVIFSTTDFSNHGHPEPLKCPQNVSRKSLALYYFSKGRPKEEILSQNFKNRTEFKNRSGHFNEVEKNNDYLKNFFRKFSWYQKMKNFEKKYLRKKK